MLLTKYSIKLSKFAAEAKYLVICQSKIAIEVLNFVDV